MWADLAERFGRLGLEAALVPAAELAEAGLACTPRIADKWALTRDDTDAFGLASQQRAARAWGEDRFAGSFVPVDAPDLVRSLVIVNSGPAMPIRTFAQRMMIWTRVAIVRIRGMRAMGQVLAAKLLPKPEHATLRTAFVERWAANDPAAYLSALNGLVNWGVMERLADRPIPMPSLLVV